MPPRHDIIEDLGLVNMFLLQMGSKLFSICMNCGQKRLSGRGRMTEGPAMARDYKFRSSARLRSTRRRKLKRILETSSTKYSQQTKFFENFNFIALIRKRRFQNVELYGYNPSGCTAHRNVIHCSWVFNKKLHRDWRMSGVHNVGKNFC